MAIHLTFREARPEDLDLVTGLLTCLYTDHNPQELRRELKDTLESVNDLLLLAFLDDYPVGLAHTSIRHDYVEGASTHERCAYLEAIYVDPDFRLQGIARGLTCRCEEWSHARDCRLFASDCELDNKESEDFHKSMGFQEVSRNIHFIKEIELR